ncbi:MAG: nucleoside 2-deoxyribosyltransferase, partial [Chloroflexota bacterium]
ITAHIFARAYTFVPHDARAMMAAALRDLRASDLLVAEVTHKAIGVGIEVGMAAALGKPIVYVRRADAEPSTTVGGLAAAFIIYRDAADLRTQLGATLARGLTPPLTGSADHAELADS